MMTRLIVGVFSFALAAAVGFAGPREAEWRQVKEATDQGLPKTAIEKLEPILSSALADKSYAEATKAIARKIALEREIQGNKAEEAIVRLQAELDKAPTAMRPAIEAILANWYWQYFQQNRWRFQQRTATVGSSGSDIQTWDLARILAEIDNHFTAALADDAGLKTTPIHDYDDLIERGTIADRYRPTLYDFLNYEALQFYQAGEQAVTRAEDEFEISADSPIFADTAEFLNWKPDTVDLASPQLKAIRLYQALLTFHQGDVDRSAFYDADLARLTFGHNAAVGENKEAHYKTALERFIKATTEHEISARALSLLASQLQAEGNPAQAHDLAARGYSAFPRSEGGELCSNLIQQIEARAARIDTEHVWNAPWPKLNVTYRNVTKVYFRAFAVKFSDTIERMQGGYGGLDQKAFAEFVATKPALAWEADLPPTKDYRERIERLSCPTSLKPGYYTIIASHDPAFGGKDNQLSLAQVWVSDLALVVRTRYDRAEQSGLVLRATSGEPVAGATVRFWLPGGNGNFKPASSTKTDENGRFHYSASNQPVIILAEEGGQAISSETSIYSYYNVSPERADSQTVFFTDRAIYRPGQAIHYKGVSIQYNQSKGQYSALSGHSVVVVFSDANGQEIARASHTTNDYGSFSGVFTAPRDRILGGMTLQVLGRPSMTTFAVEEYKRPKFQVAINPPVEAAKLGALVNLAGTATAYTGAALGGAKVRWRVERGVRLPSWCWWWRPAAAKAVAHGTAVTEANGSFKVQFTADPDRAVPEKNEPTFVFTVHADVTDMTGETRSESRSVVAGYIALQATVSAEDWQTSEKPVALAIATNSLDGDPQPASGSLTLYALKQPSAVSRISLHQEVYRRSGAPVGEAEVDPANPDSWEMGGTVAEKPFATDATGKLEIAVPLPAGIYGAVLKTKDRFGKNVTARRTVQVLDPRARRFAVKLPNQFASPKWTVEPGETFTALWGTGYETGRAFVELERDGKLLKSYWTARDQTQELVQQAVTEDMRGGFTVRITYVRENRVYINQRVVDVPWSNQQLAVKWGSFRSKLLPGQKETWTAVVTGPDAKRTAAEMVAALYDASLDQYVAHDWARGFDVFRRESSPVTSQFQNTEIHFRQVRDWDPPPYRVSVWQYRAFPPEIITTSGGYDGVVTMSSMSGSSRNAPGFPATSLSSAGLAGDAVRRSMAGTRSRMKSEEGLADQMAGQGAGDSTVSKMGNPTPSEPKVDLSKVSPRTNLNETAFFFPTLIADDDGVVKMEFTMPEALTEWKFLGFAHDKELRSGYITGKVVTAKDLMVEPNPPRFVREGTPSSSQ